MREAIKDAVRKNAAFIVLMTPAVFLSVMAMAFDNAALKLKLREAERVNAAKHAMSLEDRHAIRVQLEDLDRRVSGVEKHFAH